MDTLKFWHTAHGAQRLLRAMIDVGVHADLAKRDRPFAEGSKAHQKLFEAYVPLLQEGYDEAVPWWNGTVRAVSGPHGITQDSLEEAFDKRMAGPAANPRVVWIVRSIWLQCCELNEADPDHAIRPEYLMVQWLADAGQDPLVRLIACMPYWPIGLDEENRWC